MYDAGDSLMVVLSQPTAAPDLDEETKVEVASSEDLPWICVVW